MAKAPEVDANPPGYSGIAVSNEWMEEARLYVNAAGRPDGLSILGSMIDNRLAQGNAHQAINYLAGALINTAVYAHVMNVERQKEVDARATVLKKVG